MLTAIISAFAMSKADVWFGDGMKFRGQVMGTFAIALPALISSYETYDNEWLFIPILVWSFLSFLSLRQWGIWGELFPNDNKDQIAKHLWFVKLVNRMTKMQYSMRSGCDLIRWKRIAWGFRFAIYGMPVAALYCLSGLTLAPLVLVPVAGLVYGSVYDYGLNEQKGLLWCHKVGGFAAMLIMGLSV